MRNRELVWVGVAGGEARVVIRDAHAVDSAVAVSRTEAWPGRFLDRPAVRAR